MYTAVDCGANWCAEWAKDRVRHVIELGCNAVGIKPVGENVALFATDLMPSHPSTDGSDPLEVFVEECHRNQIKVYPWFVLGSLFFPDTVEQHPEWVDHRVGPQICFNCQGKTFILSLLDQLFSRYDFDAVQFDQLRTSCLANNCRKEFEQRYSKKMPIDQSVNRFDCPEIFDFQDEKTRAGLLEIRSLLDRHDSGLALIFNPDLMPGIQATACRGVIDAIQISINLHYEKNIDNVMLYHEQLKTAIKAEEFGNYLYHQMNQHIRINPPIQNRLLLMDQVRIGARGHLIELHEGYKTCREGIDELRKTNEDIAQINDFLKDARPLRYCAVLNSTLSDQYNNKYLHGNRLSFATTQRSLLGCVHTLLENQTPYHLIIEDDIRAGDLSKYDVLLIPDDTLALDDQTLDAIVRWVRSGGNLAFCYKAGSIDAQGNNRTLNPLHELLDIKVQEDVFQGDGNPDAYEQWHSAFNYTRKNLDHPLTDGWSDTWPVFYGNSLKATYAADCILPADVYRLDEDLLNLRSDGVPMTGEGGNVRPGRDKWPLIAGRKLESGGRVAYISAAICAEYTRQASPELQQLLVNAVTWAGGKPPLRFTSFSPTARCNTYQKPNGSMILILTNHTHNHFLKGMEYDLEKNLQKQLSYGVIRYILPIVDIDIAIDSAKPLSVERTIFSDSSHHLSVQHSNDGTQLHLDRLDTYAAIFCNPNE